MLNLMSVNKSNAKYFGYDSGKPYITSNWIAKVTGKAHRDVKRDITHYCSVLEDCSNLSTPQFFKKSHYITTQNKQVRNYHCYVKGCEMYANKMTGKRGIVFSAEKSMQKFLEK